MAQFQDGDNAAGWARWGFWTKALKLAMSPDHYRGGYFCIRVNDPNSAPWSNGAETGMALTFAKKSMTMLCA